MFPFLYYIILVVFILFKDRRSNFSSIPCGFPEWHFSVRFFQDFLGYYKTASGSITFAFVLSLPLSTDWRSKIFKRNGLQR